MPIVFDLQSMPPPLGGMALLAEVDDDVLVEVGQYNAGSLEVLVTDDAEGRRSRFEGGNEAGIGGDQAVVLIDASTSPRAAAGVDRRGRVTRS